MQNETNIGRFKTKISPEAKRGYSGEMRLFTGHALLAHSVPKADGAIHAAAPK